MELLGRIKNASVIDNEKYVKKNILLADEASEVKKGEAMCKICNKRRGRKILAELALLVLLPLLLASKQLSTVHCFSYPSAAESPQPDKGVPALNLDPYTRGSLSMASDEPSSAIVDPTTAILVPQALVAGPQRAPVRTVNPGDRVNIPCSLANSGGSIQFAKDDQPIVLDSGCAHCQLDISNDGQASLTINRVSSKDQGHWQCVHLDGRGKLIQKIPIVQLEVSNSPELPVIFVNDKELFGANNQDATVTVKENEIVTFKCLVRGANTPLDYIHWMLDSTQNVTHVSQLSMDIAPDRTILTQSVLKLNATKSMNLKSVSCLSNHQLWLTPMTVTAFLNVLYEPSFTISREPGFGVPVSEGMTVILKCEIDSNPSSTPIWIKDADNKTQSSLANGKEAIGEPIQLDTQEDGSIIFQSVSRADSGWYRCKTENKYGNFSSFGYYLNIRPAPQPPVSAPSPPNPNLSHSSVSSQQFRFPSRDNLPATHMPPARILAPNQPLTTSSRALQSVINDQPGDPIASAISSMSPSEPRCKPDGAPRVTQPVSTVNALLGRHLILRTHFCCNPSPTRVFWIHRHLAMVPGRMFGPYITRDIYTSYNSFSCYESTFEIESVKPEDIGTIYMFVSNEKGHSAAQINIQLSKHHQDQHAILASRFPLSTSASIKSRPDVWVFILIQLATLCTFVHSLGKNFSL